MNTPQPSQGYEAAHEEWLAQNPDDFRKRFRGYARREFYVTRYWKLVRQATFERDSFKCFRCGKPAAQVHHLHYDFIGEDHLHPGILVSICRECHGLVEYGRNAEALVPVIRRRIYSCKGFIHGRKGFEDQTPVKVFSRLLEYRDRLADLMRRYETEIPYKNSQPASAATEADRWSTPLSRHNQRIQEDNAFVEKLRLAGDEYQRLAKKKVGSWKGSEQAKAERIIPMLEREIENCRGFGARVVQPLAK